MVSKKRIKYPGACYHVYSRGVDHRRIYEDFKDCKRFLNIINKAHEKYNFKIHAYCLMNNHYHLCIETPEENIGEIMRDINSQYVRYFNLKHSRTGRLFESPFCDIIIINPIYHCILVKYIHLNPVKAKLVNSPKDWLWSSYNHYLQESSPYQFMEYNKSLKTFKNKQTFISFHQEDFEIVVSYDTSQIYFRKITQNFPKGEIPNKGQPLLL